MQQARMASMLAFLLAVGAHASNLLTAGQAREQSLEAAWSQELDPESKAVDYKSPIKRVVALLKEMKAQLEAEGGKEAEMYDQMVCWCETNDKDKTKAIADAEAKLGDLQAEIEGRAAQEGVLSTGIAQLKGEIAANEASLKTATAVREKEASAFNDEEKEMVQAITNLKNAVAVLGKQNAMLQLDSPVVESVRAVLRDLELKYDLLVADKPRAQLSGATALLAVDGMQSASLDKAFGGQLDLHGAVDVVPLNIAEHMLAQAVGKASTSGAFMQKVAPTAGSYAPQSSAIFGILKQMKEEFESNLSTEQKAEMKDREDYKALYASKSAEIATGKEKLDDLEGQFAENQKALSDANEDTVLTAKQRTADVEFLRNLRVTCQNLDKDWEDRSKTRAEETKAVAEAIAIISEDDAADLLRKTVTFLQQGSSVDSEAQVRRSRAASALRHAARNPALETDDLFASWNHRADPVVGAAAPRSQLSTLAVSVELDAFADVQKMMDKMISELKKQQQEEVGSKGTCEKEFNDNEKSTYETSEEKKTLEETLASLAETIENLEGEIANAKTGIASSQTAVKQASQDREKENSDFQVTIADQRATQAVLEKALARLNEFYKKSSLMQDAKSMQTPPVQFNNYKNNAGSSSVIGLIEQIVEDSKKLENEAVAAEQQSQADYEKFVKDSNAQIATLSEAVTQKSQSIASAKSDTEQANTEHNDAVSMLESLGEYKSDLHMQCDFLLKNFAIRQQGRLQEIEAIQSAKSILAGAAQQ